MSVKARRVRLLLTLGAAALLAFVAAWPSQGADSVPSPLYLARDLGAGRLEPQPQQFLAVADGPRLVTHLLADGRALGDVEVIDSQGRVGALHPSGEVDPTGAVVDPALVTWWLQRSFANRARDVNARVLGDPDDKQCWSAKQTALSRVSLPTHAGTRELTLAETLAEADRRISAMHQPVNQLPERCVTLRDREHRAGYLHNLWHRITNTT